MENLYNILMLVKERPKMYLRRTSLKYLHVFINGCIACMNSFENNKKYEFYPGFQEFIQKKYHVNFEKHWSDIIEFYCFDEEKSFYKFFDLLDEFISLTQNSGNKKQTI